VAESSWQKYYSRNYFISEKMAEQQQERGHWLDKYATNYAAWELSVGPDGSQTFKRPLGLVESSFDADGTYYGGRAGM